MNAITPYTAPEGVSLVDIRCDSATFPRLKALGAQVALARIQQVVAMAYIYTGRPAEEEKIKMVAAALLAELNADKKGLGLANITIEEIAHAVKTAILEATEDVYLNIAFLYRAICAYAQGEGHEAQEAAYKRRIAERNAALDKSPVGAMLNAYAGAMTRKSTLNPSKK